MVDDATRAERFVEDADHFLGLLREAYKEQLALEFARCGEDMQFNVERIGAKIAIMNDLYTDLLKLAASRQLEEAGGEDNQ